jgi:RNA polymerase sigma factor (sigma-70 family)
LIPNLNTLSDSEVLHFFASFPDLVFKTLLQRHKKQVYFQCRRILTIHEEADDATQNTFVKVWKSLAGFKQESEFSTWLYRIAYNESITLLNKQKRQWLELDISEQPIEAVTELQLTAEQIETKLAAALETLPEKQKLVFHYRYFDELSFHQISEILGTSEGGLKANYHHAVNKIKEQLLN